MNRMKLASLLVILSLVVAGAAFAQTTQTVVKKEVEIVWVSGNSVTFLMDGKVMQRDVPADFKVNVDGKDVPVSALTPGQKVQLEQTTTTRVIPSKDVTTIRNGVVVNVTGQTLIYREGNKQKKIVVPTDFKFKVDGKLVGPEGLSEGMKLTATIVTESKGVTTSAKELKASSTAPKAPAPAAAPAAPAPAPVAAAPAPAPAAPAPVAAPAKPAKKLPKTGSPLPLAGLSGGLLFALGAGLSALRRRAA